LPVCRLVREGHGVDAYLNFRRHVAALAQQRTEDIARSSIGADVFSPLVGASAAT